MVLEQSLPREKWNGMSGSTGDNEGEKIWIDLGVPPYEEDDFIRIWRAFREWGENSRKTELSG